MTPNKEALFWAEPEIIAPHAPKRKTARRAYTKWAPIFKSGIKYDTLCDTAEEAACLSGAHGSISITFVEEADD